jgi:hypothetical protein
VQPPERRAQTVPAPKMPPGLASVEPAASAAGVVAGAESAGPNGSAEASIVVESALRDEEAAALAHPLASAPPAQVPVAAPSAPRLPRSLESSDIGTDEFAHDPTPIPPPHVEDDNPPVISSDGADRKAVSGTLSASRAPAEKPQPTAPIVTILPGGAPHTNGHARRSEGMVAEPAPVAAPAPASAPVAPTARPSAKVVPPPAPAPRAAVVSAALADDEDAYADDGGGRGRTLWIGGGLAVLIAAGAYLATSLGHGKSHAPAVTPDAAPVAKVTPPPAVADAAPVAKVTPPPVVPDAAPVVIAPPPARPDAGAVAITPPPASADAGPAAPAGYRDLVKQGRRKLARGDYDGALAAADQALADNPSGAEALALKCDVLYNRGDKQGGLAFCDKAIAADGSNADAWLTKGMIHYDLADNAAAKRAFERFLELRPSSKDAQTVRDILPSL